MLTPLPPLTVTIMLAELRQTVTTQSCHSVCKHRRRQHLLYSVFEHLRPSPSMLLSR